MRISLLAYEFAPGPAPALRVRDWDEVWYVLQGRGELRLHGAAYDVRPGTGVYLRPGSQASVRNPGPETLVVVGSRCPDPDLTLELGGTAADEQESVKVPGIPPLVHLSECEPETTGDRWYRVLVDARCGCEQVTQFVGSIPPGRAPDHSHDYEEVLCILQGTGVMWAGRQSAPIEPGSCIYLPRGQTHCVENLGSGALLLLGVFYPAGSPAARMDMQAADPRATRAIPSNPFLAQPRASEEEP